VKIASAIALVGLFAMSRQTLGEDLDFDHLFKDFAVV
jgi:hypothetical protein